MAESALLLTVQRLKQDGRIVAAVGRFGDEPMICAVHLPAGSVGAGIVVNRTFEEYSDSGNTHAVVSVSMYAATPAEMESVSALVIDCLKDDEDKPWSYGTAEDVQHGKLGGDITGYDPARKQVVRSIEFAVAW